jgi:hypothetical protein
MRKFISSISMAVGVGLVTISADATPTCALDGVWTTSHPAGRTSMTTKLVAATHAITLDRTGGGLPDAHIEGTFTYDAASGNITLTNKSVSTQDLAFYACLNVPGTYKVTFPDCTHLALSLVSDSCAPRAQSAGHATFTKQ